MGETCETCGRVDCLQVALAHWKDQADEARTTLDAIDAQRVALESERIELQAALAAERVRVSTLERANEMIEEERKAEHARADEAMKCALKLSVEVSEQKARADAATKNWREAEAHNNDLLHHIAETDPALAAARRECAEQCESKDAAYDRIYRALDALDAAELWSVRVTNARAALAAGEPAAEREKHPLDEAIDEADFQAALRELAIMRGREPAAEREKHPLDDAIDQRMEELRRGAAPAAEPCQRCGGDIDHGRSCPGEPAAEAGKAQGAEAPDLREALEDLFGAVQNPDLYIEGVSTVTRPLRMAIAKARIALAARVAPPGGPTR